MSARVGLFVACAALALGASAADGIVIGKSVHVGGTVLIDEPVDGSLHAAGGRIVVEAPVGGDARLAGGRISVRGSVKGDLRVAGGKITIDGPVGGDVSVAGGELELGPNARIAGSLRFRGGDLQRDPEAQVAGRVSQASGRSHELTPFPKASGRWLWTAGLMLLAAIIAGALPGAPARLQRELRERPWMAPLVGLVALTCIPVAAVLVMITIIGIPLGLLALLGYAALLLVGYVSASVVVGAMLLDRFKPELAAVVAWRVAAATLAMLAIALLARIPFVGGLVVFGALVVGVGIIVSAVFRRATPAAAAV